MNSMLNLFSRCFLVLLLLTVLDSCKQVSSEQVLKRVEENEKIDSIVLDSFDLQVEALAKKHHLPGVSFAFIKDGEVHSTRQYGVEQTNTIDLITDDTMFSVGSISKVVNALLILKLVELEMLDLDENVNQYLSGWQIEDNKFSANTKVTLRRLLSHTAGLSVHGFADYLPNEELPNTLQILQGVSPAKNDVVELIHEVGSKFKYSGGGITVTQKIVEDVTGLPYHLAAHKFLFEPLSLMRTSYENPLPIEWGNIAKAHDENGKQVALPRGYQSMPEAAASGLWTTPTDLATILIKVYDSYKEQNEVFFTPALMNEMTTKVEPGDFGLGPKLASNLGDKLIQHAGANDSYRAYFRFYFEKGYGYVILTNGSDGMDFLMENLDVFEKEVRRIN